jgi:hypothetical protein
MYTDPYFGRILGGYVGPLRGRLPELPGNNNNGGAAPRAGKPSLEDRGLFVSAPDGGFEEHRNEDRNHKDIDMNRDDVTSEASIIEMEDTVYKMYVDRGMPRDEAARRAASFVGLPPRDQRCRGLSTDVPEGSVEALEATMFKVFKARGYSDRDAAREARAWVSR